MTEEYQYDVITGQLTLVPSVLVAVNRVPDPGFLLRPVRVVLQMLTIPIAFGVQYLLKNQTTSVIVFPYIVIAHFATCHIDERLSYVTAIMIAGTAVTIGVEYDCLILIVGELIGTACAGIGFEDIVVATMSYSIDQAIELV